MRSILGNAWVLLVLFAAGCGGGDGGPTNPGGGGGNTMTAVVGGTAWAAGSSSIAVSVAGTPRDGTLSIVGTDTSSLKSIGLLLGFVTGPATLPLGVNGLSTAGGIASVGGGPSGDGWTTPMSGAAGSVTITARTDRRIAGTFSFTADHYDASKPDVQVTAGTFDITVEAGLPPLPTGTGSTAVANIGGAPWNGATIVGLKSAPATISLVLDNTNHSVSLVSTGPMSAGSTYGIPSQVSMLVQRPGTSDAWYGGVGPDVGALTVTTLETDRIVGTFSATLPALESGAPLVLTGGALNVHLQEQAQAPSRP